ncbi:MAG: hypothetical protein OHK0045_06690 [Raineya sp.]
MCGIRFNHEEFSEQCYHCGKLALEEELFFYTTWSVWLCQDCTEKAECKEITLHTKYTNKDYNS